MKGQRVDAKVAAGELLEPGEYGKHPGGYWLACSPNDHMANLSAHVVEEHDDSTITVSPSIGISQGAATVFVYHGFLERGVWRDA